MLWPPETVILPECRIAVFASKFTRFFNIHAFFVLGIAPIVIGDIVTNLVFMP